MSDPCCSVCSGPLEGQPFPLVPGGPSLEFCGACREGFGLAAQGLQGRQPLPWWALAPYDGRFRLLLLQQRRHLDPRLLAGLARHLAGQLPAPETRRPPLLVPLPSWKRRCNPLPGALAASLERALGWPVVPLLERSRPTVGQHRLNRSLRWLNQQGSFRVAAADLLAPQIVAAPGLWLVDDILTTGATATAAAAALIQAGYPVAGLLCLARTLPGGRLDRGDLRSAGRSGDAPG